jgi:hypothetical protein
MDEKYKKEQFEGLKIKTSVVIKFRKYCKVISKSQSMTLQLMLDFFEDNSISPYESLGTNMTTLEGSIKKRINALIAIVKDIEKTHHKPTTAILQTLFEETSTIEKEEEEFNFETPNLITENEELDYYQKQYVTFKTNYNDLKYDVEIVLKNTKYIKSSFGNGYYRMDISKEEFENLKQKLQDVHRHN